MAAYSAGSMLRGGLDMSVLVQDEELGPGSRLYRRALYTLGAFSTSPPDLCLFYNPEL